MKRLREACNNQGRDQQQQYQKQQLPHYIAQLPVDLHFHIAQYLPPNDLKEWMRLLAETLPVPPDKLDKRGGTQYGHETCLWLDLWDTYLQQLQPALYQLGHYHQLTAIHECTGRIASDINFGGNYTALMKNTRDLVNNKYFPLFYFMRHPLCARCLRTFSVIKYWPKSAAVLRLCLDCHRHITDSLKTPRPDDGYSWINADSMKKMCGVKNTVKASDFALLNRIRTSLYSNNYGNDGLIAPIRIIYKNESRELYFMMDVWKYRKENIAKK